MSDSQTVVDSTTNNNFRFQFTKVNIMSTLQNAFIVLGAVSVAVGTAQSVLVANNVTLPSAIASAFYWIIASTTVLTAVISALIGYVSKQ